MTYLNPLKKFPTIQGILENNEFNVMDKNKIPMASLKASLDLNPEVEQDLPTDDKTFLFVA